MSKTLFQKIIDREIPATIEYEDHEIIAIRDIAPSAKLHLLVIPKQPIPSVNELTTEHEALIGRLYLVAQKLATQFGVDHSGYRLVTNTNADAGQTVFHLHMHVLGGEPLGRMNSGSSKVHTHTLKDAGLLILFAVGLAVGFNMMNPRAIAWIKPEFERVQASDEDILGVAVPPSSQVSEAAPKSDPKSNPKVETTSTVNNDQLTTNSKNIEAPSEPIVPTFTAQPGVVKEISLSQFKKLMAREHYMIDARTSESYAKGHIGSAVNYYGGEAQMLIPEMLANIPRDRTILIYCDGGECELSHHIADVLKQFGYGPMYIFTGGWAEWTR